MNKLLDYFQLLRTAHWIKNSFIFVGFIYTHERNLAVLQNLMLVTLAFCLISSAVYILNDLHDFEADRNHPIKKFRPIASGRVSLLAIYLLFSFLLVASLTLGFLVSKEALLILVLYFGLNLAYSWKLKQIPIVDVLCIAIGFMLRVLIGTVGLGIPPSFWLLVCAGLLTLLLGFGKRLTEINLVGKQCSPVTTTRLTLKYYTPPFLYYSILITGTLTIFTYTAYCVVEKPLLFTLPFVVFGMGRLLHLLKNPPEIDDPLMILLSDRLSLLNVGSFGARSLFLLF